MKRLCLSVVRESQEKHPHFPDVVAKVKEEWHFRYFIGEKGPELLFSGYVLSARLAEERRVWPLRAWSAGHPDWDCWLVKGKKGYPLVTNRQCPKVPKDVLQEAKEKLVASFTVTLAPKAETIPSPPLQKEYRVR